MMKKAILTLILCAALILCLAASALADVIYEPSDDFYYSHMEDCGHVNRTFYANAPSGEAAYAAKPGGETTGAYPNGREVYVSATYEDGDGAQWGYAEIFDTGEKGWARMDELLMKYDSQSFYDEFRAELKDYDGPGLDVSRETAVLWTYPESGEIAGELGPENGFGDELTFSESWTDGQGRTWGHIGYYYGIRDRWVCLDDPGNTAIEPVSRQELPDWSAAPASPEPDAPASPASPASPAPAPADPARPLTAVWIAVGAVVIAAVVALQLLRARRRK